MPISKITPMDAVAAVTEAVLRSRGQCPQIAPGTPLDALALESAELVEIFIILQERTGCVASVDELDALVTVGDLADIPCLPAP